MYVTCVGNNFARKQVWLSILGFFAINQNIGTQLRMHMKNHHFHMNYLKLDYSNYSHINLFQVNVICKK